MSWRQKYYHYSSHMFDVGGYGEFRSVWERTPPANTQISSLGMGKLFIQVFTCPNHRWINDYRVAAKASGITRVWPIGFRLLQKGAAKFPTKIILDEEGAEDLSKSFEERIEHLTQAPQSEITSLFPR